MVKSVMLNIVMNLTLINWNRVCILFGQIRYSNANCHFPLHSDFNIGIIIQDWQY